MTGFTETWRGDVVIAECDELGHLNMRYYLAKAQQARQMFFIGLGLPDAFSNGVPSTVRFRECHIRFLNEARPGANLRIETGILSIGECDMTLQHMLYHRDGSLAATIRETVDHIYLRTGECFNWPNRVKVAAPIYEVDAPKQAAPRGVSLTDEMSGPGLGALMDWGCDRISLGVFKPKETNVFGAVSGQNYIGRISDCITGFSTGWPELATTNWRESKVIGVMLELRLRVHHDARPGSAFHIYSGVKGTTDKIRQLIHNIVDPVSGKSYASLIAVNGLIDLDARKFVAPSKAAVEALESVMISSLHA